MDILGILLENFQGIRELQRSSKASKRSKNPRISGIYAPRNQGKLGFHESVILLNNSQGFPWKAWKLGQHSFQGKPGKHGTLGCQL